jgi:hypothetical protein
MNEIDHFKFFILCSGDMAADMDHLHVKRIHLVSFSYIVIEDFSYSVVVPPDVKADDVSVETTEHDVAKESQGKSTAYVTMH